jgi:hypothetical protein
MIIRVFTGDSWAAATAIRDAEFDVLPREGEKLVIENGDEWIVATVQDVAHRVTGDGAADVALLLGPVRETPMGDDALPLMALDGDDPLKIVPAMPSSTRGSPWRR